MIYVQNVSVWVVNSLEVDKKGWGLKKQKFLGKVAVGLGVCSKDASAIVILYKVKVD